MIPKFQKRSERLKWLACLALYRAMKNERRPERAMVFYSRSARYLELATIAQFSEPFDLKLLTAPEPLDYGLDVKFKVMPGGYRG